MTPLRANRGLFALLLSIWIGITASANAPARFSVETLDGERLEISRWPVFIITSRSRDDVEETLRCASLAGSLETVDWLIDFAWPQSETLKRLAAARLLKSPFLKSRSTVLPSALPENARMALVDSQFQILWSCPAYPSDDEWESAKTLLSAALRR